MKKRKKYAVAVLAILSSLPSFGCDCEFVPISSKYLASEVVFLSIVENIPNSDGRLSDKKRHLKIIEVFKGNPFDGLTNGEGTMCGVNYNEGDTVLIYGVNHKESNQVITSLCAGNRVIGKQSSKGSKTNESNKNDRNLANMELNALRLHKALIGETIYAKPPKMKVNRKTPSDSPYLNRINSFRPIKAENVIHIHIVLSKNGDILKYKILNNAPWEVENAAIDILKKAEWEIPPNSQDIEIELIESYLYHSDKLRFLDF